MLLAGGSRSAGLLHLSIWMPEQIPLSAWEVEDLLRKIGMDEDWAVKGAQVTGWKLADE